VGATPLYGATTAKERTEGQNKKGKQIMNITNIKRHLRRTFFALALLGTLLALPSANGDTGAVLPLVQANPDSTLSPTVLSATTWYVPGVQEDEVNIIDSTYYVLNPGTQPAAVTLSLRRGGDGTEVGTTSGTLQPGSQGAFGSANANQSNEVVTGYVVITSDVPVILFAYQRYAASEDGGPGIHYLRYPLDAFPGPRQR